jgi:putative FmdB family regulatory protein
MPIYEYLCKKCKEDFSVYQSIQGSEKGATCPRCGAKEVKKKISGFSCGTVGGGPTPTGSTGGYGGG